MKNEKTIKLYVYVDGVNDTPFPQGAEEPIEIGEFRYDAKRMGGAPTITATVNYPTCLDNEWTDTVYAKFNGEKYYLKQTPTSSYNNESTMYKHDLELVSERVILDNVYFFDAVVGDPQADDKPVSNSTKVVFFGNIHEFVKRLNSSLEYAKLLKWEDGVDDNGNAIKIPNGYHVVVDDDNNITKEERLMSFEDQFFSNVLQEIYNTYEVPYYFEGKTIHIGYSNKNAVVPTFSYGVDNALLSITKNNANYKVVNRATAIGSSDNIPFYYPNNSPKGIIEAVENGQLGVRVLDFDTFSNKVDIDGVITYQGEEATVTKVISPLGNSIISGSYYATVWSFYKGFTERYKMYVTSSAKGNVPITITPLLDFKKYSDSDDTVGVTASGKTTIRIFLDGKLLDKSDVGSSGHTFNLALPSGSSVLEINLNYAPDYDSSLNIFEGSVGLAWATDSNVGWYYKGEEVELKDLGLAISDEATPSTGDSITQKLVKYVKTSQNLMPSIYRETDGEERLYNAINYPYPKPEGFDNTLLNGYYGEDGILRNRLGEYEVEGYIHNDAYKNEDGTYIHFNNPYVEGRPKEHIFTVDDIKPTIKDTKVNGLRIDMFSEFAYDLDDNDELIENEEGSEHEYVHSYFFAKLRKLDFNLFDHAIENQPMTISFTSGDCGACNFEIGVTEEFPQKNLVQVNADGTLKRDEKGRVICGQFEDITEDECQPQQQDTINNEVWIALKKEETTYGILMPKAPKFNEAGEQIEAGHRPKACTRNPDGTVNDDGDTFVILGINLPQSYITNAEKKLEAEIIKYLKDNNDEKFTFSIGFSRIYFEENNILDQLSENSKIRIIYDNKPYDLYVSSFSYSMSEGDVLPEIRVELDETLKVSQNALQNAISQVKSELGRAIGSIDVVGIATPYFIRKDADDEAQGRINFKKGIKFGEGGKVEIMPDNGAKLTIDYLEVSKKATFNSLEIAEKKHIGGQILLTPAAMKCGEVEEFDDYYRCYFQTMGEDGDEIFNQFVVGDQAICQTYNAWGSRYYWRLVVGIGEDYIDLSKTDCDEYSDIPSVGDSIILLGNRTDITRQSAIVLSAYDDDAPSLIMYNGINSYSLVDKNITGIIWNPKTLEPQMYSYGSFFFGDRLLDKNFITFQKKEGASEKELFINANIQLGAGSSGLTNLAEWSEKQGQIGNAQDTADEAKSTAGNALEKANEAKDYIDNTLPTEIAAINDKLDGVVENWFEPYTPTKTNNPAAAWIRDREEAEHEGDTFTNTQNFVDNATTPDAGKSWRWVKKSDGTYDWTPIADSDAVKALLQAAKAQDTADQKRRIFVTTPYTPYEVGDMWTQGNNGDIMRCIVSRLTGSYQASDWDKASKYTDDTTAQEAKAAVSDLEYIKTLFPSQNIITNGAVLSSLLGVKDDNDNIVAGLNGTDLGKDTNHGKALVFAGSTNLNNISGAKTKIYEDGTVETNELIAKDGCKIGAFKINNHQQMTYSNFQDINKDEERDMLLHTGGLKLERSALDGQPIKSLKISVSDSENIHVSDSSPTLSIYQNDSLLLQSMPALSVEKASDGPAIRVLQGQFMGLRPATRTVDANVTLSATDHTILIDSSVSRLIMLPTNPQVGQEYLILMVGIPSTTVKHTLEANRYVPIHCPAGNEWSVTSTTLTANGVVYLKCANDKNGAKKWWFYRFL